MAVQRAFYEKIKLKRHDSVPSHVAISKWIKTFWETSVATSVKVVGRKRSVLFVSKYGAAKCSVCRVPVPTCLAFCSCPPMFLFNLVHQFLFRYIAGWIHTIRLVIIYLTSGLRRHLSIPSIFRFTVSYNVANSDLCCTFHMWYKLSLLHQYYIHLQQRLFRALVFSQSCYTWWRCWLCAFLLSSHMFLRTLRHVLLHRVMF